VPTLLPPNLVGAVNLQLTRQHEAGPIVVEGPRCAPEAVMDAARTTLMCGFFGLGRKVRDQPAQRRDCRDPGLRGAMVKSDPVKRPGWNAHRPHQPARSCVSRVCQDAPAAR